MPLSSTADQFPAMGTCHDVDSREFLAAMVHLLPQLERCARRFGAQPAEAKDLVQETCRRALEAQRQFHPGSDMRAWLVCILRNLRRDRARRAAFEVLMGDGCHSLVATPPDEPPAWTRVSDDDVARAVAALPRLYGDVYALHVVDGMSYDAIAARLGVRPPTVGTRLRRARIRLRRLLTRDRRAP